MKQVVDSDPCVLTWPYSWPMVMDLGLMTKYSAFCCPSCPLSAIRVRASASTLHTYTGACRCTPEHNVAWAKRHHILLCIA
jgi:hypothetical protein